MATREIRYIPRADIIRQFMEDDDLSHRELAHLSRGAFKKSSVGSLVSPKPGQGVNQKTAQAVAKIFRRDIDMFFVREVQKMENQKLHKVA